MQLRTCAGCKWGIGRTIYDCTLWATVVLDPNHAHLELLSRNKRDMVKKAAVDIVVETMEILRNREDKSIKLCCAIPMEDSDEEGSVGSVAAERIAVAMIEYKQFRRYCKASIAVGNGPLDPLKWWSKHSTRFHNLAISVRRLMCTTATSVQCEGMFSKAGEIVRARRQRLAPKSVSTLVLGYSNSYLFLRALLFFKIPTSVFR